VDAGALADHCARLTADYKKPRSIDFVEELPRNSSGKILRRALRADG
jgi:long-chain acyl-CoA synthetase